MRFIQQLDASERQFSFMERLRMFPFFYFALLLILSLIGILMLYSAAGGNFDVWAMDQLVFLGLGIIVLVVTAFIPPQLLRMLAWPLWLFTVILLVWVYINGQAGGGAVRWISVGPIRVQPSELAKYASVLLLAHVGHVLDAQQSRNLFYWLPSIMAVLLLVILTMFQPDLGTSLLIMAVLAVMLFAAGLHMSWYVGGILSLPIVIAGAWMFVLKEYQQKRVLTLLDPEADPLGAGYHIMQSKIAIGSGGLYGKGFLESTQGGLNFLPEKHTDFIFTLFGEEFGFLGILLLVILYFLIIASGYIIALRCRHQFGRLLALGCISNFFFYMCINMGMVSGLFPVVGVPLPLISKGGTSMLVIMFGFGLIFNSHIYRHMDLKRHFQ